jgi:hypothetical protein
MTMPDSWNSEISMLVSDAYYHLLMKSQYPVITAHTANRESLLYTAPHLVTSSSNRNLAQRTHKPRRKAKVRIQAASKGKGKDARPLKGSTSQLVDAFGEAEDEVGLLQAHNDDAQNDEAQQDALDGERFGSFGDERDVWGSGRDSD